MCHIDLLTRLLHTWLPSKTARPSLPQRALLAWLRMSVKRYRSDPKPGRDAKAIIFLSAPLIRSALTAFTRLFLPNCVGISEVGRRSGTTLHKSCAPLES